MGSIASQITSLTSLKSLSRLFGRRSKKTSKLRVTGISGDRWIPRTNGQLRGKCFHLMTSSCSWMSHCHANFDYWWLRYLLWNCHHMVMAWCCQATSHYLTKCWPTTMSPDGVRVKRQMSCTSRTMVWTQLIHETRLAPNPKQLSVQW